MSVFFRTCRVLSVALVLGVASGCASRDAIDASSTESIIGGVNRGDYVRVVTRTDVVHKFVVTKITNKALYGENERVAYEDMQKVEVLDHAPDKGGFWSRLF